MTFKERKDLHDAINDRINIFQQDTSLRNLNHHRESLNAIDVKVLAILQDDAEVKNRNVENVARRTTKRKNVTVTSRNVLTVKKTI